MNENKNRHLVRRITAHLGLIMLVVFLAPAVMAVGNDSLLISKEVLKAISDSPSVAVVDVRKGKDWDASEYKIKGATRQTPKDTEWATNYPKDTMLVLYCA